MKSQTEEIKWVAIQVKRGFIVEARGYRRKTDANKQIRAWRRDIFYNRDYDETEIHRLLLGEEKSI